MCKRGCNVALAADLHLPHGFRQHQSQLGMKFGKFVVVRYPWEFLWFLDYSEKECRSLRGHSCCKTRLVWRRDDGRLTIRHKGVDCYLEGSKALPVVLYSNAIRVEHPDVAHSPDILYTALPGPERTCISK